VLARWIQIEEDRNAAAKGNGDFSDHPSEPSRGMLGRRAGVDAAIFIARGA
jgi:hypothetical protein